MKQIFVTNQHAQNMIRTAYVSGKITGLPKSHVNDKFTRLTNELLGLGYTVVNPIDAYDNSQNWDEAVRSGIKKMVDSDEVHMLPDWQESRGAQLERDIALRLGKEVVYH